MSEERVLVTKEGLASLQAELEDLISVQRPQVIRAIALAREEGDLRENAGYDAARHDQALIERRISELEDRIRRAEVIDRGDKDEVTLGSTVTIEIDGESETYTIVGAVEARPAQGRISNESPIGRALLGGRIGQEVEIQTPAASLRARIVSIDVAD